MTGARDPLILATPADDGRYASLEGPGDEIVPLPRSWTRARYGTTIEVAGFWGRLGSERLVSIRYRRPLPSALRSLAWSGDEGGHDFGAFIARTLQRAFEPPTGGDVRLLAPPMANVWPFRRELRDPKDGPHRR